MRKSRLAVFKENLVAVAKLLRTPPKCHSSSLHRSRFTLKVSFAIFMGCLLSVEFIENESFFLLGAHLTVVAKNVPVYDESSEAFSYKSYANM